MGNNRRTSGSAPGSPSGRYPKGNRPGGRAPMPQRTRSQQLRLWVLSLCGAVPGAVVVYLTDSFWAGAGVFLAVVIVLGLALFFFEKRKRQ